MTEPTEDPGTPALPAAGAWQSFAREVLDAPWGSIAKSELEFKVFHLLTTSGAIDLSRSDGDLATQLEVSVARVRTLRYRLDQRTIGGNFLEEVVRTFEVHRTGTAGDVHVAIDSRYLRERFTESLREHRIAVRRELAGELLRLRVEDLVWFFVTTDDVADSDRDAIIRALVPAWEANERTAWSRALGTVRTSLGVAKDGFTFTQRLLDVMDRALG